MATDMYPSLIPPYSTFELPAQRLRCRQGLRAIPGAMPEELNHDGVFLSLD